MEPDPGPDEHDGGLTDERIVTSRREALRRFGGAAVGVAFGGLAAACGPPSLDAPGPNWDRINEAARLSNEIKEKREYRQWNPSSGDADEGELADPKDDADVTRTGDPQTNDGDVSTYADPKDGDVTTSGDPAGYSDSDSGPYADPAGYSDSDATSLGDFGDSDATVPGDNIGDNDYTYQADPKDQDVTTHGDPTGGQP